MHSIVPQSQCHLKLMFIGGCSLVVVISPLLQTISKHVGCWSRIVTHLCLVMLVLSQTSLWLSIVHRLMDPLVYDLIPRFLLMSCPNAHHLIWFSHLK